MLHELLDWVESRYENTVGRRRVVVETLARNKKPGGQKAEE